MIYFILVVPLQERGQFLSIWCRIIEKRTLHNRKLVMLWPLFMVRSYLPVVTKINIHTPALNVHLESVIRGRAELQQLYCPGTIDHSHNLTFDYGYKLIILLYIRRYLQLFIFLVANYRKMRNPTSHLIIV